MPGRPLKDDYNDNRTYATKLGTGLTENWTWGCGGALRHHHAALDQRRCPGPGGGDTERVATTANSFTRGTRRMWVLVRRRLRADARPRLYELPQPLLRPERRRYRVRQRPLRSFYRGDRVKLDWQGNHIKIVKGEIQVTIGAEHELDRINDSTPARARVTNDAGLIQLAVQCRRQLLQHAQRPL